MISFSILFSFHLIHLSFCLFISSRILVAAAATEAAAKLAHRAWRRGPRATRGQLQDDTDGGLPRHSSGRGSGGGLGRDRPGQVWHGAGQWIGRYRRVQVRHDGAAGLLATRVLIGHLKGPARAVRGWWGQAAASGASPLGTAGGSLVAWHRRPGIISGAALLHHLCAAPPTSFAAGHRHLPPWPARLQLARARCEKSLRGGVGRPPSQQPEAGTR
jgi:hypothetical protein